MAKLLSRNRLGQFFAVNHFQSLRRNAQIIALGFGVLAARDVHAQAPALLWRTNVGASVIAMDSLTNVYASAGGTVVTLNSDGVPLQTNVLSQLGGRAQRDAAGNFYFAGIIPGFNSGGIYQYGTTNALFLAKYSSTGTLIWSNGFGPIGSLRGIGVNDVQIDASNDVYVGFTYFVSTSSHVSSAAKFDSTGSNVWTMAMPKLGLSSTIGAIRFGNVTPTNGYVVTYDTFSFTSWTLTLSRFDSNGTASVITNWPSTYPDTPPLVQDPFDDSYGGDSGLTKRDPSGAVIWQSSTVSGVPVGRDFYGGAHVSANGNLSRSDADGNLAWTTNYPFGVCKELLLDASGNRFLSFSDGSIGRMGPETLAGLAITNQPQAQTVFAGSNVTFSVGASGTTPFRYYWFLNDSFFSLQTNASLTLTNVTANQAGSYYVIVSNLVNTVTSAPVQLRVKQVGLFIGNQLLTNGAYTFATNPVITVRSAFTNGSVFYTLDGSAPDFSSMFYSGPFGLFSNVTVRAIGYSADFSHSEEADQINAVVLVHHTLKASTPGGGGITLSPPGGDYTSATTVTATAVPNGGWSFLYWTGDASGTNAALDIPMHADYSIIAVFGTTLSTTVQGNGQVVLYPASGIYGYGQTVRVTGVPGAGGYFGFWGNAATGNTNPLYFTVTSPNPTISSIFGTNNGSQVNIYLTMSGRGGVTANPQSNIYTTDQSVLLTATPGPGASFVNWSGDVSSTQNPLNLILNQSKTITANFTGGTVLKVNPQLQEGLKVDGFRFSVLSDPGSVLEIRSSSNLMSWDSMGFVTNQTGEIELVDPSAVDSARKFYKSVP